MMIKIKMITESASSKLYVQLGNVNLKKKQKKIVVFCSKTKVSRRLTSIYHVPTPGREINKPAALVLRQWW